MDKLGVTKEVMDKLAAKVFDKMGLTGWGVEYTSGMFEGGINPSAIIRAQRHGYRDAGRGDARVWLPARPKGMVAFDEKQHHVRQPGWLCEGGLAKGLSTSRIDAIRKEIAAKGSAGGGRHGARWRDRVRQFLGAE